MVNQIAPAGLPPWACRSPLVYKLVIGLTVSFRSPLVYRLVIGLTVSFCSPLVYRFVIGLTVSFCSSLLLPLLAKPSSSSSFASCSASAFGKLVIRSCM